MYASDVSYRETSTTDPSPVRSRSSSAARMPTVAHVPVPMSISARSDADAGPTRLAGHRDQTAGGLHERVVAGLVSQRPDVTVRADRAVDEPRVARTHGVGAEPEPLGETGAQALEEHVGALRESQQRLAPARVAQRDRERALAGVRREEHRALAVPERRAPGAAVVTRVGALDLDHVARRARRAPERSTGLRSRSSRRARASRRAAGGPWRPSSPLAASGRAAHARMAPCSTSSGTGSPGSGGATSSSSPCRRSTRSSRSFRARASSSPRAPWRRAATSSCSA